MNLFVNRMKMNDDVVKLTYDQETKEGEEQVSASQCIDMHD